jgi:hypothetical protein
MSAMTMEFDGVRELSMEEVDAVSGGSRIVRAARWLRDLIRDGIAWETGKAMVEGEGGEWSDYDWNEAVKDLQESGGYPRCGIGCPY